MKPRTVSKPMFKHDCDSCIFLGNYIGGVFTDSTEMDIYDLYYCPGDDDNPIHATVIARYGNAGWEYQSGMNFARPDGILPLYEAKLRAKDLINANEIADGYCEYKKRNMCGCM